MITLNDPSYQTLIIVINVKKENLLLFCDMMPPFFKLMFGKVITRSFDSHIKENNGEVIKKNVYFHSSSFENSE